jgi:uncharacterized protein YacL
MDSIYLLVLISLALIFTLIFIGSKLSKLKANVFFIGTFAVIVGLLIGTLAYLPLSQLPGIFGLWIPIIFYILAVVTSVWLFLARRKTIEQTFETAKKIVDTISHLKPSVVPTVLTKNVKKEVPEIAVDTSVLIDGRIADIVKTGFLMYQFLIPRFILAELQNIADSEEPIRRAKGRRGLDVLQELKNTPHLKIQTLSVDIPEHDKVDAKLVHFAKTRGADVLTTDYNLNKVAKIEGVKVLNINELSQALRPVIIPGEEMDLKIVQAGKERNQGVGYLPDGTMIVVEEGDKLVGKNVKVEIKRVLQTAAGKMFFAIIKNGNGSAQKKQ